MPKALAKIEPVHNPRMRYTLVYPDGTKQGKEVKVIGYLHDRQGFIDQQLHGEPIGTHVENLRQVDRRGRDLPAQPAILLAPDPRTVKHGTVPASATARGGAGATRPKRLAASDAAEQIAKENGEEFYAGVPPYVPPEPSRELDHDADLDEPAAAPPVVSGMAVPDPTRAVELPPGEAAVRVVGEPRLTRPPTESKG